MSSRPNWARATWISAAAAMLLLVLLGCVFAGRDALESCLWIAGFAAFAIAAGWVFWRALRWVSDRDLFAPWLAFPICYVLWFAVGSIEIFAEDPIPYGHITLGLVCYMAGVWFYRYRSGIMQTSPVVEEWLPSRFKVLLQITAAVAAVAYLSIAVRMGIPALHADAAEQRSELLNYGIAQFLFLCGAWTVVVFLSLRFWTEKLDGRDKVLSALTIATFALMIFGLASRGLLLIPLATLVVARHYLFRRVPILKLVGFGLVIFAVASAYGWMRDTLVNSGSLLNDQGTIQFDSAFYLYYYIRNTVTTLRDIMQEIPAHVPFQHGYLSFGALLTFLPGHRESSDMFFRRILGLDFVGFGQPATLLGPMYADFGTAGIVTQMFAFGFFYAWLYSWMQRKRTPFRVIVYGWTTQVALFSLFGALLTYAITLAVPVGWAVLNHVMTSGKNATPDPSGA